MKIYSRLCGQAGIVLSLLVFCVTCSCDPKPDPAIEDQDKFDIAPEKTAIAPGIIDEASGLAASANMPGYLWTNQDSGKPNSLYLISRDGKSVKEFNVPGTTNRDWEDVAVGPGPDNGVSYLYIGDIGNNDGAAATASTIYRVAEIAGTDAAFKQETVQKITFTYPDGPRDAESLIVDPVTKDIFIISKENQNTGVYRLPFPQSVSETMTAEKVATAPGLALATGSGISSDGSEILVRTYLAVSYWKRGAGETVGQTLTKPADKVLVVAIEPQGESVCFDRENKGFFTLSEKGKAASVTLNYYKRK